MLRKPGLFLLCALILILSAGIVTAQGDAGTGKVRVVLAASAAPDHNIIVDGKVAGTVASDGTLTSLNLDAGAHTFGLVPASGNSGVNAAQPINLDLKAGDQHMVYAVWASAAERALVIHDVNESAILAKTAGSDGAFLYINGLSGAPPVDIANDGKKVVSKLVYGASVSVTGPVGNVDALAITGAGMPLFDPTAYFLEPKTLWTMVLIGRYPGQPFQDYAYRILDPLVKGDAADFLASFSKVDVGPTNFTDSPYDTHVWKFDTFLNAVKTAGLSNLLNGDDPITVFAPTDAAFDRLPPGTLNELMTHPVELKQVIENHLMEGATDQSDEMLMRPLTLMGGSALTLSYSSRGVFLMNGDNHGCNCAYDVSNGRVYVLDDLLIPRPEEIPTATI